MSQCPPPLPPHTSPSPSYFHGVFVCFVTMQLAFNSDCLKGGKLFTWVRHCDNNYIMKANCSLSPESTSEHWLPIAPGEACILMNPLFSPHSWWDVDGSVLAGACCLQTSSSWSHTRDLSATLESAGICHHVQLHTIFYEMFKVLDSKTFLSPGCLDAGVCLYC